MEGLKIFEWFLFSMKWFFVKCFKMRLIIVRFIVFFVFDFFLLRSRLFKVFISLEVNLDGVFLFVRICKVFFKILKVFYLGLLFWWLLVVMVFKNLKREGVSFVNFMDGFYIILK